MISDELHAEALLMVDEVCPELSGRIYLCEASIFTGLPMPQSCLGFSWNVGTLPHDIRDRLELAGLWCGELRPGIAIDAEAIAEQAGYGEPFRLQTLATILHEVAHTLPFQETKIDEAILDATDDPDFREHQRTKTEAAITIEATATPDATYNGHDRKFARRLAHLYARARFYGLDVGYPGFGPHAVSPAPVWVDSVLDQAFEMRDASFDEIDAADEPARFTEVWDCHVFNFRYRRATPEQRRKMEEDQ